LFCYSYYYLNIIIGSLSSSVFLVSDFEPFSKIKNALVALGFIALSVSKDAGSVSKGSGCYIPKDEGIDSCYTYFGIYNRLHKDLDIPVNIPKEEEIFNEASQSHSV
jgi:hypothetical protein